MKRTQPGPPVLVPRPPTRSRGSQHKHAQGELAVKRFVPHRTEYLAENPFLGVGALPVLGSGPCYLNRRPCCPPGRASTRSLTCHSTVRHKGHCPRGCLVDTCSQPFCKWLECHDDRRLSEKGLPVNNCQTSSRGKESVKHKLCRTSNEESTSPSPSTSRRSPKPLLNFRKSIAMLLMMT